MENININFEDSIELFLKEAEKRGLTNDALFSSTFSRYRQLIENLKELQQFLINDGIYCKDDSGNVKINPVLTAFNTTCAGADRTASLLHKIISRSMPTYDPDEFMDY